ncbi:MAG: hypothetical protein AAF329_04695 [Cyanobacteria bacterium P01_A01_bin.17]
MAEPKAQSPDATPRQPRQPRPVPRWIAVLPAAGRGVTMYPLSKVLTYHVF